MSNYIISLKNKKGLNFFSRGDVSYFSLKSAREHIKFFERLYPQNKGKYKILRVEEIKHEVSKWLN